MRLSLILLILSISIASCSDDSDSPESPDRSALVAEFQSVSTAVIQGGQVTFQDMATGEPTGWNWTFEGGTPATSTDRNPVINYNQAGSFQVSLTVTRDDEEETVTKDDFIKVVELYDGSELPTVQPCQLDKVFTNDFVDLGFPNNGPSPSLGTINVQVLFADFPDAAATKTTEEVLALLDPVNVDFFEEMSYGRMTVNLIPHHGWLRLSRTSGQYAMGLRSAVEHLAFIQEAVDLADNEVDFSETDIVLVMSNPDAQGIPYGPAFGSLNSSFAIQADGNSIRTGVTSGYDINHWGGIWLAHEMGHSLGLHDLYSFTGDAHQYVGTFGMMGLISGQAPGFFAYERWLLGWLDDAQIYCHQSGEIAIEIEQLATAGGVKAIMVPLSNTKAVVVESRKRNGFDTSIPKEGAIVYVVDTSIPRGDGPIQIRPTEFTGSMKEDAAMQGGDVYSYEGVRIEVVESKRSSDVVLVSVE